MADAPVVVRASDAELRKLFNETYLLRVLAGNYQVRNFGPQTPFRNEPAADGRTPEPKGTISGLIEIIDPDTNLRIAIAHRLLRPDGSFGASGYPDPKMVVIDGVIHLQKRKEGRKTNLGIPSLFTSGNIS
jgi:hypothetical protein